jgi:hypothetical protein
MTSRARLSSWTPEQVNQVFAQLAPIAHYLARVKARAQATGPCDELLSK